MGLTGFLDLLLNAWFRLDVTNDQTSKEFL